MSQLRENRPGIWLVVAVADARFEQPLECSFLENNVSQRGPLAVVLLQSMWCELCGVSYVVQSMWCNLYGVSYVVQAMW